jgi:hypothetical protein
VLLDQHCSNFTSPFAGAAANDQARGLFQHFIGRQVHRGQSLSLKVEFYIDYTRMNKEILDKF